MVTTVRELRRLQTAYELTTSDVVREVIEDAFREAYADAPLRLRVAYLVTAHVGQLLDDLRRAVDSDFPGWIRRAHDTDETSGGGA